jgi:hypothetical protein
MPDDLSSNDQPTTMPGTASPEAAATAISPTPTQQGRTILIHGYSAQGTDFTPWHDALVAQKIETVSIEIGNYVTLNNEVSIKDLGEAFDRALRLTEWSTGTTGDDWTFDAIVHSTGMLVLRQWLTSDPYPRDDPRSRIRRLKHLVGIAPATFGSPQAKQGRSLLGALVKGNRTPGPDFLNAGDMVLDGLELGSRYTWELTHKDLVTAEPLFDESANTPYVAVFIGNVPYSGIAAVSNKPGTDGTVRWAGCSLDTRKVTVDLRHRPNLADYDGKPILDDKGNPARYWMTPWVEGRIAAPMIAIDGQNHGTIIQNPQSEVVALVSEFFRISSSEGYQAWEQAAVAFGQANQVKMDQASAGSNNSGGAGWQQIVVRMSDDHGDGVDDYNLQFYIGNQLTDSDDPGFAPIPIIADTYTGDASYRCFYLRLTPEMLNLNAPGTPAKKMWMEIIASSGSSLLEYEAYLGLPNDPQRLAVDHNGGSAVKLDLTYLAQPGVPSLLFPYTTTLLEIFVEREPLPLGKVSQIFTFLGHNS